MRAHSWAASTPSALVAPADQEAARDWSRRDRLQEINAAVEADDSDKMKKPSLSTKTGRLWTSSILSSPGNADAMAAALEADAAEQARAAKTEWRTVITSAADNFAIQARRGSTEAVIFPWSRPMGVGARSSGSLAHCDIDIDTCDGADASSKEITSSGLPASQDDVMHHLGLAHKLALLAIMSKPKHKSMRAHKIAMVKRMGEKGVRLSLY